MSTIESYLLTTIKGGKGRTGTCIATWMLATDFLKTADLALRHFGERRTDEKKGDAFQGVETPSQILISTKFYFFLISKFLFCLKFFSLEILSDFKIFSKVNRAM